MDSAVTPEKPGTFEECKREMIPMHEVLQQISGKWTVYIIGELSSGPRRFSELRRHIEGISQKMLTATLRELEKDGLVSRKVTPSIPPRVDYELTDMGRELRKPLGVLGAWARLNRSRVDEARRRYEAQAEEVRSKAW